MDIFRLMYGISYMNSFLFQPSSCGSFEICDHPHEIKYYAELLWPLKRVIRKVPCITAWELVREVTWVNMVIIGSGINLAPVELKSISQSKDNFASIGFSGPSTWNANRTPFFNSSCVKKSWWPFDTFHHNLNHTLLCGIPKWCNKKQIFTNIAFQIHVQLWLSTNGCVSLNSKLKLLCSCLTAKMLFEHGYYYSWHAHCLHYLTLKMCLAYVLTLKCYKAVEYFLRP